ncbi:MAG: MBL fold metallo-hydrolase [Congregibacter sp.]
MSDGKTIEGAVRAFFDEATSSYTYVLHSGGEAAIIDPVLGFDPVSGVFDTERADEVIGYIVKRGLNLRWILETHVHADHLSAARYVKGKLGGDCCISSNIPVVQKAFHDVFAFSDTVLMDGSQFDHLLEPGERLPLGDECIEVLATPGHTPACMTYVFRDGAFVGDTIFMPDNGTARTDFPGGDAQQLYRSIHKIFALGGDTKILVCHDYLTAQRTDYRYQITVEEQRIDNTQIHAGIRESDYVRMRQSRDKTLRLPKLFYPSVQFNLVGGHFDAMALNGRYFLRTPVNAPDLLAS